MRGGRAQAAGIGGRDAKLRVGIVGLGRVATATHIPVLKRLENVSIAACAEKNTERVRRVHEFMTVRNLFESYVEMYDSGLVDAVYICLPPHLHCEATLAALERGIHVLCEKPMGVSLEEAEAMTRCATSSGLVLMPGFKYRYNDNLQKAAGIVSGGVLGALLHVDATFLTPGPYISWDPKSDWYLDPRQGGVVYDIGVHIVELLHMLVPDEIVEIFAKAVCGYQEYDTPTGVACTLSMASGAIGTMNFAWRSSIDMVRIDIFGTGGALSVGLKRFDYLNAGTDPKDRIVSHVKNAVADFTEVSKRIFSIVRGTEVSVNDLRQSSAFVNAALGNAAPPVSGADAVYVHRVLRGIAQSIELGRPVPVGRSAA